MAKSATADSDQAQKKRAAGAASNSARSRGKSSRDEQQSSQQQGDSEQLGTVDILVKLLESPLVIDLLAVGASAALAALAEHRFSRRQGGTTNVKTSRALKAAGSAAASAVGRRLSDEWQEIRSVSEKAKAAEAR